MIGCGAPAAPAPPSLNLPTPVVNLSAVRIGDSVHLAWTMPTRTTDHLPLRHPVTARICRAVDGDPCTNAGTLSLAPGAAGTYTDVLPSDLAHKPDRLLRYEVVLAEPCGQVRGPFQPCVQRCREQSGCRYRVDWPGAGRMVSCLVGSRSPIPDAPYSSASSACN